MKTIIQYITLTFLIALIHGCIEDKGNYDYLSSSEVMPIEIEGLEKEMDIQIYEQLQITPDLKNMDNPEKYTYEWYVMEYQATSKAPEKKHISNSRNLDYKVTLDPGAWRLEYKVIDSQKNVFTRAEIKLNVFSTPVDNKGWYILKDNGEETDFDYINTNEVIYKDVLRELGLQLPGTAICMEYQNGDYHQNTIDQYGNVVTLMNQTVFHILSTKEIYTLNSKTLQIFKNFEEQFYTVPEICNPQSVKQIESGSGTCFLINDNKIYSISGATSNIGKVSPISGFYSLYKDFIPCSNRQCIVFDQLSNSFMMADAYVTELQKISDLKQEDITYSFSNMPYTLICTGYNKPYFHSGQGYAVMKNIESEGGILLRINGLNSTFTSVSTIAATSKLLQTDLITMPSNAEFLYFKYGNNHIYSYEDAKDMKPEDREKEIISFPEGETITSMTQIFEAETQDTPQVNQLAVLTTQNGKWKLYLYNLLGESNPEINTSPVKVYIGEGNGRFLLYRKK